MNKHKQSPSFHAQLPKKVYRWHKRIGVTAALFVIWIVITGWMLNHTDALGLAHTEIRSNALANWYGLAIDEPQTVFTTQDHWFASTPSNTILDGHSLAIEHLQAIGLAQSNTLIAVAAEHFLLLLSPDGHLIDTLNATDLPIPQLKKIGSGCDGIVISDDRQQLSSQDGIDWKTCAESVAWSQPHPISASQRQQLRPLLIPALSLEKITVDLHTGRFFGRFGPYVVDAIGGGLLFLALSGFWLFFRLSPHKKHREAPQRNSSKPNDN